MGAAGVFQGSFILYPEMNTDVSENPEDIQNQVARLSAELGMHKTVRTRFSAYIRQSGPDSGPGVQMEVLKTLQVICSWLESDLAESKHAAMACT